MGGTRRIIRHFPHFFQSEEYDNTFYRLMEVFGSMLDLAEEDLLKVMRSHWVDTADNLTREEEGFLLPGDLDKLFALYLESLGGTSLLKQRNRRDNPEGLEDDALYRRRIKALIRILMEGASDRAGIQAIVAANLGIFGDSQEAVDAIQQIEIEEYLPEYVSTVPQEVNFYETFFIKNPSPDNVEPDVTIEFIDHPHLGTL